MQKGKKVSPNARNHHLTDLDADVKKGGEAEN
jgi:hypothetical protein